MKKIIIGFVLGALVFSVITAAAVSYVANPVDFKVMVNGQEFVSDPPALEVNGSTYLPLRAMGNALGVPVNWNEELRQAEVGNSAPVADAKQYSRNNPAPINTVQMYEKTSEFFDEDNYTVAVRVLEVVRGDAAYKALTEKNKFYPKADEGYEYANVRVAFSVVSTKSDFAVEPYQGRFKAFSSSNEESPENYYTSVEPVLGGKLYTGGNTEGWITVMVKKGDINPKIAYGLDYNGAGGIWFALQ